MREPIGIPEHAGSADANGIAWYKYDIYLNFDSTIRNGTGNLQQLGQTKITCKIPANLQENGAGALSLSERIIANKTQEIPLWDRMSLKIEKGGTAATAVWSEWRGDNIALGEHVKLHIEVEIATLAQRYK